MIDKFEMFIALAREQHFSRAAEACCVTQPSLSSAIRALEDFYGMALVKRGSRFMGLTPEGEKLLLRARNIVAEARAIRADLQDMKGDLEGELRIGVIPTSLSLVDEISAPFLARYPKVRLNIHAMSSQSLIEALSDFQIDLAISYGEDENHRPRHGGFHFEPLRKESWAILYKGPAKAFLWHDISNLRLGLLSSEMQNRRILDKLLKSLSIEVTPLITSSSLMALVSHVLSNAAEAVILPAHPAGFFAQMPGLSLCALPPCDQPEALIGLLLPLEGRRRPIVSEFHRFGRMIAFANHPTETSI